MSAIERLYGYCLDQENEYLKLCEALGAKHYMVREKLQELIGVERAFKYLSGYTVTDYTIMLLKRKV